MKKCIIDIETGGFSITKNGVCEIGALIIDENYNVVKEFHRYIKPYTRPDSEELVSYKEDAMSVNGITEQFLIEFGEDVSSVMEAYKCFLSDNETREIIGHNSDQFDLPRIAYLLENFTENGYVPTINSVDTIKIARQKLNCQNHNLPFLCNLLGINNDHAHTALGDCYSTLELYKLLTK